MSKLTARLDRLERRAILTDANVSLIIYDPLESPEETLARYGLPENWDGEAVWLPEVDS